MQCPHCADRFYDSWTVTVLTWKKPTSGGTVPYSMINVGTVRAQQCPACSQPIYQVNEGADWRTFVPRFTSRPFDTSNVPAKHVSDYREAVATLPVSAKASAALSRRCLQGVLNQFGYTGANLAKQIDALLAEADTTKAIPIALRDSVDAIRNFGNFSAHPIDDTTTLQVIDVDPGEAEWCIELVEQMFEHFFTQPARAAARKAALNAKLTAAGKPPAK